MPYELHWLVEKRVTYARFHGVITIDVLAQYVEDQNALVAEGTPLVHSINDTLAVEKIDFNLRSLQVFSKTLKQPEGVGWHLDVSPKGLRRFLSSLALQFSGTRFRQFDTIEEAVEFIQENDPTLPPIDLSLITGSAAATGATDTMDTT